MLQRLFEKVFVWTVCLALACGPALAQQRYVPGGAAIGNNEGTLATYSATIAAQALQTAAGDVACLQASSTKTVKLTHIEISGTTGGTAGVSDVVVFMRTALDTGGTSGSVTIAKHYSTDAVATASVVQFTGISAPTPGAGSAIRSQKTLFSASTGTATIVPDVWDFGIRNSKAVELVAGSTQAVCINFASGVATNSVNATFEWTEQ